MEVCVKPLYTETDYEEALNEVANLMGAKAGTSEYARLHVLTALVESYEAQHHPVPAPDPVSAILHYLDSTGTTRKQLAENVLNCTEGRVSEILNRKRSLTIGMMRRLHERLGISAEILLRDYALDDETEQFPVAPVKG